MGINILFHRQDKGDNRTGYQGPLVSYEFPNLYEEKYFAETEEEEESDGGFAELFSCTACPTSSIVVEGKVVFMANPIEPKISEILLQEGTFGVIRGN